MKRKTHTFHFGWEWVDLEGEIDGHVMELLPSFKGDHKWYEDMKQSDSNYTHVIINESGDPILLGSLFYNRNEGAQHTYTSFHYVVTKQSVFTLNLDLSLLARTNEQNLLLKLERCMNAPEGFMMLLGEIINSFLDGLDGFEDKLVKLESEMHENNSVETLDQIFDRRYELLNWSNLMIPIKEIKIAAEEAFLDDVIETVEYKRTCLRIERIWHLVTNYKNEMDTLINMDTNISAYRGNEIMKTLTVFTAVFTPSMVLGAIWGMNFTYMPELDWKLGYIVALASIVVTTGIIYFWLRYKGWTGDILQGKKKDSHLK